MKTKIAILVFTTVFFLLGSCIPSLHPLYTADKLVEIADLPGTWVDEDYLEVMRTGEGVASPESWVFSKEEDKSYFLIHKDGNGYKAAFVVHAIKLGGNFYIDFYPNDLPETEVEDKCKNPLRVNDLQAIHMYPVHTFAKMEIDNGKLTISMFDPEFLENLLKKRQIRIKNEKTDSGYILTASPEELQKFVAKYGDEEAAYLSDPFELKIKM